MKLGEIAYNAYCESVGGVSAVTGDPLPAWEDQRDRVKLAWESAALAVLNEDRRWKSVQKRIKILNRRTNEYD